jgi:hypothetical protein
MTKYSQTIRSIAEFLVVGVYTLAFLFTAMGIFSSLLRTNAPGTRDFVEYWAAGQQLVHHSNPYDIASMLKLEQSVGFPPGVQAQMVPNPPSALLLVLPIGLLGPKMAELLWELLLLGSLAASIEMLRRMHGHPKNLLHLLGYSFAPVLSCLLAGQVALFILLGLVLFLWLHRSQPFLAGASLWLCLLKPHLFLPFGVVLLLWIVLTRSYKILAGTAVALAASSAIATMIDPLVWMQYRQMMSAERIDRLLLPCLGSTLRFYVKPHTFWLQCLPAALGCIWAVAYFMKHRDEWDWVKHGSPLMLVSMFVAPYTWFTDQAVLIPALLNGAYRTRSRTLIAVLALMSAFIEIEALRGAELRSAFYLWTAPGWLLWYFFATRPAGSSEMRNAGPEIESALPH